MNYNLDVADFSLKIKAEQLGKSLEQAEQSVQAELREAVKNIAVSAYNTMVAQVQSMSMDPKNRQDYLRGLQISPIGDDAYIISLDGEWANKLEQGFEGYDMKERLLSSTKTVGVGSRAGMPWVRKGKKGKFASVPFEHKPFSGEKFNSGDLATEIKKLTAMNMQGKEQALTKTFKDLSGNPIAGKVAKVTGTQNKNLEGITKFQYVNPSGRVSSVYLTFRTVSENSSGWKHKGFRGYNIFKSMEEYVDQELENIVNTLL